MTTNLVIFLIVSITLVVMPSIATDYRFEHSLGEKLEDHIKHGHTMQDHKEQFLDLYYDEYPSMYHAIIAVLGSTSIINTASGSVNQMLFVMMKATKTENRPKILATITDPLEVKNVGEVLNSENKTIQFVEEYDEKTGKNIINIILE